MKMTTVKERMAQLVVLWGGARELAADLHVYGGGLLVAAGLAALTGHAAVGPLVFGLLLTYIGLRR